MNKLFLGAALAGLTTASIAMTAHADDKMMPKEKCYGISKAGENSCKSAAAGHSCAGQSTKDNDPNEFKLVDAGTCTEAGGKLAAAKAM